MFVRMSAMNKQGLQNVRLRVPVSTSRMETHWFALVFIVCFMFHEPEVFSVFITSIVLDDVAFRFI